MNYIAITGALHMMGQTPGPAAVPVQPRRRLRRRLDVPRHRDPRRAARGEGQRSGPGRRRRDRRRHRAPQRDDGGVRGQRRLQGGARREPARRRRAVLRHLRDLRRQAHVGRRARAAVLRRAGHAARRRGDLPGPGRPGPVRRDARGLHRARSSSGPRPSGSRCFEGTDACVAGIVPFSEASSTRTSSHAAPSSSTRGWCSRPPLRASPAPTATLGLPPSAMAGQHTRERPDRVGRRRRRRADRTRRRGPGVSAQDEALPVPRDPRAGRRRRRRVRRGAALRRARRARRAPGPHRAGGARPGRPRRLVRASWSAAARGTSATRRTRRTGQQVRGEARLRELALQVVEADFPFLGACYGIGTLGTLPDGVVDRQLRRADRPDDDRPDRRRVGRTSCSADCRPASPRCSATRRRCPGCPTAPSCWRRRPPARCRRSGSARTSTPRSSTPSSTSQGIITRIEVYQHFGYFEPHLADEIVGQVHATR